MFFFHSVKKIYHNAIETKRILLYIIVVLFVNDLKITIYTTNTLYYLICLVFEMYKNGA